MLTQIREVHRQGDQYGRAFGPLPAPMPTGIEIRSLTREPEIHRVADTTRIRQAVARAMSHGIITILCFCVARENEDASGSHIQEEQSG